MKTTAFSVAALAAVANAGLVQFPTRGEAANVCKAKPYASFTAISALPSAQSYCHSHFPLATPTCLTTKTVTATTTKDIRKTYTEYATADAYVITTIKTGAPYTHLVTKTLSLSDIVRTTTLYAPDVIYTCSEPSSTSSTKATVTARAELEDLEERSEKLSNKQSSSLKSLLASVTKMGKKAEAETICHCIQTNPACTKKTTTKHVTKTISHENDVYVDKTTTLHLTKTTKVPNHDTVISTVSVFGQRPTTTITQTIHPYTTSYTGVCGVTSTSSKSSSTSTKSSSTTTSFSTMAPYGNGTVTSAK